MRESRKITVSLSNGHEVEIDLAREPAKWIAVLGDAILDESMPADEKAGDWNYEAIREELRHLVAVLHG